MTTYTWKIANMDRLASNGFVTKVSYSVTKVDGASIAELCDAVMFTQTSNTFVPFDTLTPEVVIGWVQTAAGGKEVVEATLSLDIFNKTKPTQVCGVPWSVQ